MDQQEYHHQAPPSLQLPTHQQSHYRTSSGSSNDGGYAQAPPHHSHQQQGQGFPPTPAMSPFAYQPSLSLHVPHHQQSQQHSGLHSPSLYTPPPSAPAYGSSYKNVPYRQTGPQSAGADDSTSHISLRRHSDQPGVSRYPLVPHPPPPPIGIPPIATLPGTNDENSATSPGSGSDFNSPRFEPEQKPILDDQAGDCTAFISKLYHLLSRPEYSRFLRWNEAGDAFILMNSAEFAQFVLPRFFRHSNVSSFVRQINLYGFQRVSTICILEFADINAGDPTQGTDAVQASGFTHPFFRRGQRHLLKNLKPRSARRSKKAAAAAAANGPKQEGDSSETGAPGKGKGKGRAAPPALQTMPPPPPPPAAHA